MKIYQTNIRYFVPTGVRCIVSRHNNVKLLGFDKVSNRQIVFNLSKQLVR